MQAGPTVTQHAILYRVGRDSRVNRANIATLKRVVSKSTTPVALEIYYHEPLKLLDWALPHERVRYVKLRSGEDFPIAERMAQQSTDRLLVLDDTLLISASDIWLLLGLSASHAVTVLRPRRSVGNDGEGVWRAAFREARLALNNYLYPAGDLGRHAFALNKALLAKQVPLQSGSLGEKITYRELLRALSPLEPHCAPAHSVTVQQADEYPLLNAGVRTVEAVSHWRKHKQFPWWFSARSPLFHVAQLAAFYSALVALISPGSGLIVFFFAVAINPQYFFAGFAWRRWKQLPVRMLARCALYFVG